MVDKITRGIETEGKCQECKKGTINVQLSLNVHHPDTLMVHEICNKCGSERSYLGSKSKILKPSDENLSIYKPDVLAAAYSLAYTKEVPA